MKPRPTLAPLGDENIIDPLLVDKGFTVKNLDVVRPSIKLVGPNSACFSPNKGAKCFIILSPILIKKLNLSYSPSHTIMCNIFDGRS